MVRSSARGPLTHVTPRASSACRASTRKMTCSSDPRGMPRTITASQSSSHTSRLRTATSPSMRPTMRVTGSDAMLVAARGQRIGELLRVPAAARAQDRDGQPQNERSSTSRLTAPASKLRPLATLVSLICAGLNSSGSIS